MMSKYEMRDRLLSFQIGNFVRMFMDENYKPETLGELFAKGTYIFKRKTFDLLPCSLADLYNLLA